MSFLFIIQLFEIIQELLLLLMCRSQKMPKCSVELSACLSSAILSLRNTSSKTAL
jgi:hypothetical protein